MHFLKSFVAGLFTLVFGVLVVATICVFSISAFATKDNIVNKMQDTDILTEVKKIRNSGSTEGASGVTQVIDEMYSLASQFSVSEEVVDQIIDSNLTKEIIGEAVGNLTDYMVNGKDTKVLSEEEAYNLISDNLDEVLEENDLSIDEGQKEKFLREVEKQLPDVIEVIPTSEDLLGSSYGSNIERIQTIFSDNTKILLCASLVISGAIVIVLKRKEFEWCANLGVALLIAGLVTIGISFVMPGMVIDMMGTTDLSMFATSLTDALAEPILYSGVGVLVLAIVLFIFYRIMEKRRDNKIKS